MKREIKFRGRRIDNSKWIIGNIVVDRSGVCQIWDYANHESDTYTYQEVWPKTVGQYTGLKDKNGKEIYEGDIYCMIGSYFKVIFENGAFCVTSVKNYNPTTLGWKPENEDDCCVDDFVNKIEIIGNIYENPELLKSVDHG